MFLESVGFRSIWSQTCSLQWDDRPYQTSMGWRLRSYSHDLEVTQIKMPLRLHTSCLGSCCLCFLGSINGCLNLWIYLTKKNGFRSHAVVVSKWVQRWSLGLDFCFKVHVASATNMILSTGSVEASHLSKRLV